MTRRAAEEAGRVPSQAWYRSMLTGFRSPWSVRAWQAGDRFSPRGMKGKIKKLQDFFTDRRSSPRTWKGSIVGGTRGILWVVGMRQDERFVVRGWDDTMFGCLGEEPGVREGVREHGRDLRPPIVTQEEGVPGSASWAANQTDYTGKDFVLVGVLKGAYAFYADLAPRNQNSHAGRLSYGDSDGSRAKTSGKGKM